MATLNRTGKKRGKLASVVRKERLIFTAVFVIFLLNISIEKSFNFYQYNNPETLNDMKIPVDQIHIVCEGVFMVDMQKLYNYLLALHGSAAGQGLEIQGGIACFADHILSKLCQNFRTLKGLKNG